MPRKVVRKGGVTPTVALAKVEAEIAESTPASGVRRAAPKAKPVVQTRVVPKGNSGLAPHIQLIADSVGEFWKDDADIETICLAIRSAAQEDGMGIDKEVVTLLYKLVGLAYSMRDSFSESSAGANKGGKKTYERAFIPGMRDIVESYGCETWRQLSDEAKADPDTHSQLDHLVTAMCASGRIKFYIAQRTTSSGAQRGDYLFRWYPVVNSSLTLQGVAAALNTEDLTEFVPNTDY